ncbi:protein subunit of ribonuclease P [Crocosphaera subtropica ATCC 51142]|uniref:Ribonuclease P protein component n=1 Tax=Crocosphaera subtropica (strain ATCC 51142 / BH68) TaxID=43989 RepID=B1WWJ2_CROS5|nr:ribonuclease P protein component [Crocosphaera subtropica]ACB50716.1 protein subunit of ribonuclease P [Crocosphaera subtropica ATCC 51142]
MGLPKQHRLRHPKIFQTVYNRGKRYQSPHLVMRVFWQADQQDCTPPTQFGISVSQKVSKKAVIRNRLKRQIKAVIRLFLPKIKPGYQVVIVVKRNTTECKYEHFLRELEELLINAEIIYGYKRKHIL